jgi:uncharacterized protein (TIGR03000 family)
MIRTRRCLAVMGVLAAVTMIAAPTSARAGGWGSYGSYGGSSGGSWGSYGGGSSGYGGSHGSWGLYGGSSGGFLSRLVQKKMNLLHWKSHSMSHGSSGGMVAWGSYGGSYGSHGGYGSHGSHGSAGGGMYYRAPMGEIPMDMPMDAPMGGDAPAGDLPMPDTNASTGSALLNVSVPESARVFVNGRPTSSTGAQRQYVSRGLAEGFNYTYEIRAEATVDGRVVQDTKVVKVRAGQTIDVAFAMQAKPETTLTLRVPEDARVTLAGNETSATGELRVYRTTSLSDGQTWSDYQVRVTIERDGQTLTREQTIQLAAGESRELAFDFAAEKVAAR